MCVKGLTKCENWLWSQNAFQNTTKVEVSEQTIKGP